MIQRSCCCKHSFNCDFWVQHEYGDVSPDTQQRNERQNLCFLHESEWIQFRPKGQTGDPILNICALQTTNISSNFVQTELEAEVHGNILPVGYQSCVRHALLFSSSG